MFERLPLYEEKIESVVGHVTVAVIMTHINNLSLSTPEMSPKIVGFRPI